MQSPNPPERWLRRIFIEDWSLKLLALAITLVLWFLVSGRIVEREVIVEPKVQGKPAASFEVKDISATPSKITVHGPADRLNVIDKAETQPISVEGRRESFDVRQVAVRIPNYEAEPLGQVDVHVTIVASGNSQTKPTSTY
jgi:YbbR domain-containing protein